MKRCGRIGVVTGTCLAATVTAGAQERGLDQVLLEEIRVESEAAQDTLGNTVITQQDIARRNPTTLGDVFDGESEITVSGGASIAQKIFVHGIEESLLSVTIDGARQNKSAFHHTGNVLLDPALLRQVEVSSGLAPADSGPGALAGLLAYETLDARDLLYPDETIGGQITTSFGSNGREFRAIGTMFGQHEGFEVLLSAASTTGQDYEDGSGVTVRGTEADVLAGVAKLAYTSGAGHRFELEGSITRDEGDRAMQAGPGGLYFARPDFAGVVGRDSVYLPALSERRSLTFNYTDELPEGQWAPTAQLTYNEQLVEAGGAHGTNTSLSGKAQNDFQLLGGVLSAGLDFFHDTAEGHGQLNLGDAKERLSNIGLYAQMRQDIGDRVSLSYGARVDAQRFELADDTTHNRAGVSANGQVDVRLIDQLSLNLGGSTVWGGYELSEASLINLGGEWDYGRPDPSRSYNGRAGLRYEIGPFTANAALFWTSIENIDDVLTAARSDADLTSKGVDASLRYTDESLFAELNYTYADVELNGEAIPTTSYYYGRPVGHIFGLSAGWQPYTGVTLGGTAQVALDYDDFGGTGVDLDGYEVVNLFASWRPEGLEAVEVRLDVKNIFDETYAFRTSDGIGIPGSVIALNEPGRSVALTVSVRF